jgi:hypothetical protein
MFAVKISLYGMNSSFLPLPFFGTEFFLLAIFPEATTLVPECHVKWD